MNPQSSSRLKRQCSATPKSGEQSPPMEFTVNFSIHVVGSIPEHQPSGPALGKCDIKGGCKALPHLIRLGPREHAWEDVGIG